jgi:diadenosine tetraphosphate (Ap4A) HIT family hydrolase
LTSSSAPNQTIAKFGYPDSLIAEYRHWVVLLRPQQATLGALILACKSDATAFAEIDEAAFGELKAAAGDIETVLGGAFDFEKINYLMLMMVDPQVHFHVIPRYGGEKSFAGETFSDPGWPTLPDLASVNEIGEETHAALRSFLRERWPKR